MNAEELVKNVGRDASRLGLAFGGAVGFVCGVFASLLLQDFVA